MGCIRPATPGFLLTLLATACLAVVSFCVPFFKSIFFLKAVITQDNVTGTITFGTLGYCVELAGTTTCSKPSVGYELDINSLVGNKLPIEIPDVVVKWLTYVLVLHIVALVLAAGAAIFGLLAHVREMSTVCCSTCISGFAGTVALVAFVFDIALFFLAKARINAVGKASIGNAIWLTLAAWILLFLSGCFYSLGRCCLSNRKRGDWNNRKDAPQPELGATDQMRLDAVKAEADRKARQKANEEGGLPAFHERQPLTTTAYDDGSNVYLDKPQSPGGYVQAAVGTRAVDQYYNNSNPSSTAYSDNGYAASAYPPSQNHNYAQSTYAPSTYSHGGRQQTYPQQQYQSTPPLPSQQAYPPQQYQSTPPLPSQQAYPPPQHTLSPPPQQFAALGAVRTASPQQQPNPYLAANPYLDPAAANTNPYLGHAGHPSRATSYHSAATHQGEYSQYDPYDTGAQGTPSEYYPAQSHYGTPQGQYDTPQSQYSPQGEHDDVYGGYERDGYGANSLPPLDTKGAGYFQQPSAGPSTQMPSSPTSPKGPRNHRQSLQLRTMNAVEEDSPPGYEQGASEHVPGAWGKK